MKKQTILVVLLVAFLKALSQETLSGVYLSFEDYNANKLSYASKCEAKNSIRLNETFNSSNITVKFNGKKIRLNKESIYAVNMCTKPLVRFQNKEEFYLEEKGMIWIFYNEENVHGEKTSVLVKHYYFCVNGNDILKPLSVTNIKYAFPNKDKFHDLLDDQFKTEDASVYDSFHKMYKINHLLKYSLN